MKEIYTIEVLYYNEKGIKDTHISQEAYSDIEKARDFIKDRCKIKECDMLGFDTKNQIRYSIIPVNVI